jgi:hypothetical protein
MEPVLTPHALKKIRLRTHWNQLRKRRIRLRLGCLFPGCGGEGAVLIGQVPDCHAFHRHFDWQDAVVEMRSDGSDGVEVISKLLAEPERLPAMSSRKAAESLRRHDWVYRWKQVLRMAGLTPRPAMAARERRLGELAEGR